MPDCQSLPARPRMVLMCHAESRLNREAVARWLTSFSDLVGMVVIEETSAPFRTRIRREIRRVGPVRFLDVVAFRLYYGLVLSRRDNAWLSLELQKHFTHYKPVVASTEVVKTQDPNSVEVEEFLRRLAPDMVVARCKRILKERIFSIPTRGTFVLHPGVCPEYRNAHGAFWALAKGDYENVGLTLIQIDRGVDTGPVYGYFRCDFDEVGDSHIVIMSKLLLENLDALRDRLLDIHRGRASTIDTTGRRSAVWGQPWLTSYLGWKRRARRRHAGAVTRVS